AALAAVIELVADGALVVTGGGEEPAEQAPEQPWFVPPAAPGEAPPAPAPVVEEERAPRQEGSGVFDFPPPATGARWPARAEAGLQVAEEANAALAAGVQALANEAIANTVAPNTIAPDSAAQVAANIGGGQKATDSISSAAAADAF